MSMRAVVLLLLLFAAGARAQFANLDWTLHGSAGGSGAASASGLHVVGPDDGGCLLPDGASTWLQSVAPMAVTVSAVVQYVTFDVDPFTYDAPAWFIDGQMFQPPVPEGWTNGSYTIEFDLLPGQSFGFGVWAADCCCGPGVLDISDLVIVPRPWCSIDAGIDPETGPQCTGRVVAGMGDVDGDGLPDLIAGDPTKPGGHARFVSGKSGATLQLLVGPKTFGATVDGAGDLNGDGVADAVVGAPGPGTLTEAGKVFAFSGADGAQLYQQIGATPHAFLGTSVAGLGDLDGDGHPDVGVGRLQPDGSVLVLGGADGHLVRTLQAGPATGAFGSSVAGLGDADLDGVPDVAVGAPGANSAVPGSAFLFSGATGALLATIPSDHQGFAATVAAAGDLDGDGRADVLLGDAPASVVTVRSGLDGSELLSIRGAAGVHFGETADGGSNLGGDGTPDIVTAESPPGGTATLLLYDGATGALLHSIAVPGASGDSPRVAVVGNVDGTGGPDAALALDGGATVRVFVHLDGLGAPTLAGVGDVVPSTPAVLRLEHALPGAPAIVIAGHSGELAPLLGGLLVPHPDYLAPLVTGPDGSATLWARWPPGLPAGTSVWTQVWIHDPSGPKGWTATNGLIAAQAWP